MLLYDQIEVSESQRTHFSFLVDSYICTTQGAFIVRWAFCAEMDKGDSANDEKLDFLQDQLSIASGKFSEYVDIAINDGLMTAIDIINQVQNWSESRLRKNLKKV